MANASYVRRIAKLTKERLGQNILGNVPDRMYHVSPKEFDKFKQQERRGPLASDLGFHFGSEKTIQKIIRHIGQETHHGGWKKGDPLYKYTVSLDIKNPVRLQENRLGSWSASSVVQAIMEDEPRVKGITDKMVEDYDEDQIFMKNKEEWWSDSSSEEEKNRNTIKWMNELGYDGIVYKNAYEGGGDSYIALKPSQIKILSKDKI